MNNVNILPYKSDVVSSCNNNKTNVLQNYPERIFGPNFTIPDQYSSISFLSNNLRKTLESTKEEQGIIGKTWDKIKNFLNLKTGSKNVENTIKQLENGEISREYAKKILTKYQNGQKASVDFSASTLASMAALGAVTLASVIFTGGAALPIASALLMGSAVGAVVYPSVNAIDAATGHRKYDSKDLWLDAVTGAINGALAPITEMVGGVIVNGTVGRGIKCAAGEALSPSLRIIKMGVKKVFKIAVRPFIPAMANSIITSLTTGSLFGLATKILLMSNKDASNYLKEYMETNSMMLSLKNLLKNKSEAEAEATKETEAAENSKTIEVTEA